MTVGTVSFYSFKGALSSAEYPLVTGSETATHTVSNVKYQKGLQTTLDVPTFTGFDTVNVAKIDGNYYWVTSFKERTNANGQIHYTLDFMAPTSMLYNGGTIKGIWRRTPTGRSYLKDEITNDVLAISSSTTNIGERLSVTYSGKTYQVYFWQISGYDSSNNIKRFAGLFCYDSANMRTLRVVGAPLTSDGGVYADFEDLFENMNACIGILPENVIDFSISARMPYIIDYIVGPNGEYEYGLIDQNNAYIYPTQNGTNDFFSYDMQNLGLGVTPKTRTVSTSLSFQANERTIGRLGLIDWNGNSVMDIPTELAVGNTITMTTQTVCDISGMYSIFKVGDIQLTLPEGRLPYNSNTWETYKAYQMNSDRELLANTVKFAEFNRQTQTQTGVFNAISSGVQTGVMTGIMAGNPVGAIAGIPMALLDFVGQEMANDRALKLTEMQANADYELSKRRAIEQPQTSYNAGYGFIYCILNELRPMKLALSTPKNMNTIYDTDWFSVYGRPDEGVNTVNITYGFYQGKIIDNGGAGNSFKGMYFDELNSTFEKGFRFVSPT